MRREVLLLIGSAALAACTAPAPAPQGGWRERCAGRFATADVGAFGTPTVHVDPEGDVRLEVDSSVDWLVAAVGESAELESYHGWDGTPTHRDVIWDRWHERDDDTPGVYSAMVPRVMDRMILELHHRTATGAMTGAVMARGGYGTSRADHFAEVVGPVIEACIGDAAPTGAAVP